MRPLMGRYILLNGQPVLCEDLDLAWAWRTDHPEDVIVAKTQINDVEVSTVFLTLDHNHDYEDPEPILFETMIFGGALSGDMERYETLVEARAGHERWCEKMKTSG